MATVGADLAPAGFRLGTTGPAVRRAHIQLRTALPADQATVSCLLCLFLVRVIVGDEERGYSHEDQN